MEINNAANSSKSSEHHVRRDVSLEFSNRFLSAEWEANISTRFTAATMFSIVQIKSLSLNSILFYLFCFKWTNTHCMAVMLRKVDSVRCKEQGRWTGWRSSTMEQTSQPKLVPVKRGEQKNEQIVPISNLHAPQYPGFSFYFNLVRYIMSGHSQYQTFVLS